MSAVMRQHYAKASDPELSIAAVHIQQLVLILWSSAEPCSNPTDSHRMSNACRRQPYEFSATDE